MHIKEEYRRIIEDTVKESKYYPNNEHLLDEFCESIYQKTYLILGTKQSEIELREYLKGVAHRVIVGVLKKYAYDKYLPKDNQGVSLGIKNAFKKAETPLIGYGEKYSDLASDEQFSDYENVPDPLLYIKDKSISKNFLRKVVTAIYDTHQQMPNRLYFQIFYYKYFKQVPQTEVAKRLGITQSELSKRLIELVQIIKGFKVDFD